MIYSDIQQNRKGGLQHPPVAKFASQGNAHVRIKFLYYPLLKDCICISYYFLAKVAFQVNKWKRQNDV